MKLSYILSFVISIFCCLPMEASVGHPEGTRIVENYYTARTGSGGQVWQIGVYDDSWVYFATKDGMLQFDGCQWTVIPTRNGLDARSVCIDNEGERILVAGINEFGYLEPDNAGRIQYVCLSDSLPSGAMEGNNWGVFRTDNGVLLQADYSVLKYENGKLTKVHSDVKLDSSDYIDQVLYLGTESGLKMLAGNKIMSVPGTEALSGQRIRRVLPYDRRLLIVTSEGIYDYDGTNLHKLSTAIDSRLPELEIYSAALRDNTLALGTVLGGVYIVDLSDGSIKVYNRFSGLQNETVLSLAFDRNGDLWVGTDNGIDHIRLTLPVSSLSQQPLSVGSGYTTARHGDNVYIGTNRGLFIIKENTEPFGIFAPYTYELVDNLRGQVWGLAEIDGRLYCMHDRGLFEISGKNTRRVSDVTGVWDFDVFPDNPNMALAGTYTGFVLYDKGLDGQWTPRGRLSDFNGSGYNVVIEDSSHLWVYDNLIGITRLTIDPASLRVTKSELYDHTHGLPVNKDINISRMGDIIYFATPNGAYKFNGEKNRIELDSILTGAIGNTAPLLRLVGKDDYVFALTGGSLIRIKQRARGQQPEVLHLPLYPANARPLAVSSGIDVVDSLHVVMPNHIGYTIYDFANMGVSADSIVGGSKHYGRINELAITSPVDSVIYRGNFRNFKLNPEIPYSSNSIRITFGGSAESPNNVLGYRYRLNDGAWSDLTPNNVKEYTDLSEGNYTFEVEAYMSDGTVSSDSISFYIRPPWYRSGPALVLYFILLVGVICGILWFERRRVRLKGQEVAREKDRELAKQQAEFARKEEEQENRIADLEKDKLQLELEHKSQEIANLLISLSSKHEALIDFKSELKKLYSTFHGDSSDRKQILALQSRIDSVLQAEGVMGRIEKEFDLVHNNFIKKLRQTYPTLIRNELMMCVYIKMNLSNKEIAPLMNMSPRGVETLRYRMRRKLGLERENSLTEFLKQFG